MVDYKLRLGDGTTFQVDEKGLNTWLQGGLVDDKARIQPAGSKKWFSLKQVLAAQGAQRGHAERQTDKGRADVDRQAAEETAAIERRVAEQRAAEEKKATEDVAAAERKAEHDRTEAERKVIEERANAERRAAEELAAAEARQAAEKQAERDRIEGEKREAEERAAAERSAAEAAEAARIAEAESQVAAERAARAEKKRKVEEARLAEEARKAEEARAEVARVAEAERRAAERASEERQARERAAAEEAAREVAMEALRVTAPSAPPATEIAIEPAATMTNVGDFERELALVPVTFNDATDAPSARVPSPSRVEPESRDERSDVPSIKTPAAMDNAVRRVVKVLDVAVVGLVRALKSAGPKVNGLFARRAAPAQAAEPVVETSASIAPATALPVAPPVAPTATAVAPAPMSRPAAAAPVAPPPPWAAPPPPPWNAPRATQTKAATPAPALKQTTPPPSHQKMEVIPFAATPFAPQEAEEMWEGEDQWQDPGRVSSAFSTLWRWTKRVTIATALIVTVALLALNRQKWQPQAESAAISLGQGVDELSERASTRTVPPPAIAAAAGQSPHLRPQTIELVMARSTEGVLDPTEVFRRAHLAAERAHESLPPTVSGELDSIMTTVANGLDAGEAERLRAYLADLRAGNPTAVYQDKEATWLMSRAVRRLPAERLARLQELMAQAVPAGLAPKPKP